MNGRRGDGTQRSSLSKIKTRQPSCLAPLQTTTPPAVSATHRAEGNECNAAEAPRVWEGHHVEGLNLAAVPPVLPDLQYQAQYQGIQYMAVWVG